MTEKKHALSLTANCGFHTVFDDSVRTAQQFYTSDCFGHEESLQGSQGNAGIIPPGLRYHFHDPGHTEVLIFENKPVRVQVIIKDKAYKIWLPWQTYVWKKNKNFNCPQLSLFFSPVKVSFPSQILTPAYLPNVDYSGLVCMGHRITKDLWGEDIVMEDSLMSLFQSGHLFQVVSAFYSSTFNYDYYEYIKLISPDLLSEYYDEEEDDDVPIEVISHLSDVSMLHLQSLSMEESSLFCKKISLFCGETNTAKGIINQHTNKEIKKGTLQDATFGDYCRSVTRVPTQQELMSVDVEGFEALLLLEQNNVLHESVGLDTILYTLGSLEIFNCAEFVSGHDLVMGPLSEERKEELMNLYTASLGEG